MRQRLGILFCVITFFVSFAFSLEIEDAEKIGLNWIESETGNLNQWKYLWGQEKKPHEEGNKEYVLTYQSSWFGYQKILELKSDSSIRIINSLSLDPIMTENQTWLPPSLRDRATLFLTHRIKYYSAGFDKQDTLFHVPLRITGEKERAVYLQALIEGWQLGVYRPLMKLLLPAKLVLSSPTLQNIWLDGLLTGYEKSYTKLQNHFKEQIEEGEHYFNNSDRSQLAMDIFETVFRHLIPSRSIGTTYHFIMINVNDYYDLTKPGNPFLNRFNDYEGLVLSSKFAEYQREGVFHKENKKGGVIHSINYIRWIDDLTAEIGVMWYASPIGYQLSSMTVQYLVDEWIVVSVIIGAMG